MFEVFGPRHEDHCYWKTECFTIEVGYETLKGGHSLDLVVALDLGEQCDLLFCAFGVGIWVRVRETYDNRNDSVIFETKW